MDQDQIVQEAIHEVENNGIVFLDEIDKICAREGRGGADVSREGVQRDLLPLIEGTTVSTKHGAVKTDHMLFIASGAFHIAKPSDLLPELQGRLPIRVELSPLDEEDFRRILVDTEASLIKQYQALMKTEGVDLVFTPDGVNAIAKIAVQVNSSVENIGARRLQTVMERVLDEVSYSAPDRSGEQVEVTAEFVEKNIGDLARNARSEPVHSLGTAYASRIKRPASGARRGMALILYQRACVRIALRPPRLARRRGIRRATRTLEPLGDGRISSTRLFRRAADRQFASRQLSWRDRQVRRAAEDA